MPLKEKYQKIYDAFIKRYGKKKGEQIFWAWCKKNKINPDEVEKKSFPFAYETKAGEFYVEGYITTPDVDVVNDVVTEECMEDIVEQVKNKNIKLDIEHEAFTGRNPVPVGRIIEAKKDEKGVWVKAVINKHLPEAKRLINMIKDRFIDAFSITYKPVEKTFSFVNDKKVRLLKKINLLNVALTGVPVNPNATIENYYVKSKMALPPAPKKDEPLEKHRIKGAHRTPPKGYPKEKDKYADPNNYKYPIDTEEHVRAALAYFMKNKDSSGYTAEEKKAVLKRIIAAAKKFGIEVSDDVLKEAKSVTIKMDTEENEAIQPDAEIEQKAEEVTVVENNEMAELKSAISELRAEIKSLQETVDHLKEVKGVEEDVKNLTAEVKSLKAQLEQPVFKAEESPEAESADDKEVQIKSVLNLIR